MESTLENLAQQAKNGSREALESLVQGIQDRIYALSLRMLGYPADAEDAAQEILMKIVTHLDSFRQESAFNTWMYRIAANHLLTTRKRLAENQAVSFEEYETLLDMALASEWPESVPEAERSLVVKEVMLSCTHGMLLCLDRPHRITFILSEIFDITSQQGAYILDITPAAYRKRLSRARDRIRAFMLKNCGAVNAANPCHCEQVAPYAIQTHAIDPKNLVFAWHRCRDVGGGFPMAYLEELDSLQRMAALFKSHPDYAAPETCLESLKELVRSGQTRLLGELH